MPRRLFVSLFFTVLATLLIVNGIIEVAHGFHIGWWMICGGVLVMSGYIVDYVRAWRRNHRAASATTPTDG